MNIFPDWWVYKQECHVKCERKGCILGCSQTFKVSSSTGTEAITRCKNNEQVSTSSEYVN